MAGKMHTKAEADSTYGAVLSSVKIDSSLLLSLCRRTKKYLMFRVMDGTLVILADKRKVLYPKGFTVDNDTVFAVYSKELIEELLKPASGKITSLTTEAGISAAEDVSTASVEVRSEVLSITSGLKTLEGQQWCPPVCW